MAFRVKLEGMASRLTVGSRRLFFQGSIVLALAVLAVVAASNMARLERWHEVPHACDWFGFLRQAKLFRDNGFFGGLDTAVRDANSLYLIDRMKRLEPANPLLAGQTGPFCHWYHVRTDRLAIVSPPGTGFGLSLFAEGIEARAAFMAYTMLVFAGLAALVASARFWTVPWITATFGVIVLLGMFRFNADWSIQPTVPLAVLSAYFSMRLVESAERRSGALWAIAFGLCVGLAVNARLLNVLLAAGIFICLGVLFLRQPRWRPVRLAALSAVSIIVGALPTLAANTINAGHFWTPTYGPGNSRAFSLGWDNIASGLRYYVVEHQTVAVLAAGALALLVLLFATHRRLAVGSARASAAAGIIVLVLNFAFAAVYINRLPYLPFPALVYAQSMVSLLLIRAQNQGAAVNRWYVDISPWFGPAVAAVAIAAVAGFALDRAARLPVSPNYTRPDIDFTIPARAIVWATTTGGYYYLFLDRQSGSLYFGPGEQDRIMAAIAADGVPQFVVRDYGNEALVRRLQSEGAVALAGRAFGAEVYAFGRRPQSSAEPEG